MKKSLLKASLICLVTALLFGLLSFKTIEGTKSQCIIKKAFIQSDLSGCKCVLQVEDDPDDTSMWFLYFYNYCSKCVRATFTYDIYHLHGPDENKGRTDEEFKPGRNFIDKGVKSENLCCPGSKITACLLDCTPEESDRNN